MKSLTSPCHMRGKMGTLLRQKAAMFMGLCALSAGVHAVEPAVEQASVAATDKKVAVAADRRLDFAVAPTNRLMQSAMLAVATAGRRVVAVGERGLIGYSDDCGANWKQASVPVGVTLTALKFVDDRTGWAVGHGGVILVTHDAGATWQKQLDGRALAQLALAKAKESTAPDASRLLRDAERLVADGPDKPLFAVHFWTPQRGFVAGAYGITLVTEDGGAHWEWASDRVPNPAGSHLYGIWVHEHQVYMVGEQGLVVHSTDDGRHFKALTAPYAGSYFGIVADSEGHASNAVIFGLRGHAFQLVSESNTFKPVAVDVQAGLLSMLPRTDGNSLLFDADGQILELQKDLSSAKLIGMSQVGPVLGVTRACGSNLVFAGLRGLMRVDPKMLAANGKEVSK